MRSISIIRRHGLGLVSSGLGLGLVTLVLVLLLWSWSWSCHFGHGLGLVSSGLVTLVLVLVLSFWSWFWSCEQWSWSWSCYFGLGLGLTNLVLLASLTPTRSNAVLPLNRNRNPTSAHALSDTLIVRFTYLFTYLYNIRRVLYAEGSHSERDAGRRSSCRHDGWHDHTALGSTADRHTGWSSFGSRIPHHHGTSTRAV